MGIHNRQNIMERAHLRGSGRYDYLPGTGYLRGWGSTSGNGVEGWAPKAKFYNTTGQDWVQNTGSASSASWAVPESSGLNISGTFAAGQALIMGTFGSPISYTGNELIELHGRVSAATTSHPLMRVRNSTTSGTDMTTGQVVAIQAQAYNTGTDDCASIEAIEGHVGIKAACTIIADVGTVPNMRAAWFKIEDLGNDLTLTGEAAALVLGIQFNTGTTLTGNCDWISLLKEGSLTDPADAFVRVYDGAGGGWATNFLDIPASLPYDAADGSDTKSGKMACKVGGATKYIYFYSN